MFTTVMHGMQGLQGMHMHVAATAVAAVAAAADRRGDQQRMTVRQLYRAMRTPALVTLREAFTLDAVATDSVIVQHYCTARIALIGEVLRERIGLKEKRERDRAARAIKVVKPKNGTRLK